MSHDNTGLRSVLRFPKIYLWAQLFAGSEQVSRSFIEDYLEPAAGMRILDVGCGPATLLKLLPTDIYYRGIDINADYILAANRQFGKRGVFEVGRAEALDANSDGEFDRIICFGLLHHLTDSQVKKFLVSAMNLMSYDGRLVTIDPCFTSDQNWLTRTLIKCDRGQSVRTPQSYLDLIGAKFSDVQADVRNHMGRIPWTHCVIKAWNSKPTALPRN